MSAFDPKRTFGPVVSIITYCRISIKFKAPILSPALSMDAKPVGQPRDMQRVGRSIEEFSFRKNIA
jgi:hypothetical protein